jgi:hypothetical protein
MQRKNCWVNTSNYQIWDENIRLGHTELDTETLHLQELIWLPITWSG